MGMTGSGTGSITAGGVGEAKFLPPPIIGDLGLPISDGGRVPPTTEPLLRVGPPTTEPETEPDTDAGSGTRAARVVCEARLVLVLERGVGGAGYETLGGMGAAAYAGVERPDSFFVRAGGVVKESTEPMPDDTLDSDESSSRRLIDARVYGRLEPDWELLLEGWRGMTGGGPSPE